ncbi:hypothetical protein F4780DRAFT_775983 [Xylariomycetidae sp. FL0641]|nr:hypothetical protein F4780DRAFT_775983 [Xylariomycetidae sp. FL0641]
MGKKQPPSKPSKGKAAHSKPSRPSATSTTTTTTSSDTPAPAPEAANPATLRQQQDLLDVFQRAFSAELGSAAALAGTVQAVKAALYARDFGGAFGAPARLAAYAARWSPSRALGYAQILRALRTPYLRALQAGGPPLLRVLAVGGGAAELVALGAYLRSAEPEEEEEEEQQQVAATLLDRGPWDDALARLRAALTTPPPLSAYASAGRRAANRAVVAPPSRLDLRFAQQDVLAPETSIADLVSDRPLLVTLLFTLNELYTAGGVGRTTGFLRALTAAAPPGSLLLVVDSPGNYAEAAVGREARRYPMAWLLDHTLLGDEDRKREAEKQQRGRKGWVKLESHESVWFRLADGLRYPIALENMRYQMHLYRAVDRSNEGGSEGEGVGSGGITTNTTTE